MTMIRIQVRYFAALREALGDGESVELEPGSTLGQLRDRLCERGAEHARVLARPRPIRAAQNHAMCDESAAVIDGAEVAFFPPVTGG